MATVSEQLRQAVERCGESRYRIGLATNIPASTLSRFVASGKGLRTENVDKLCAYLGLRLTGKGKPAKRAKGA